eukprot:6522155-Pyramimonas_sp.AAC.1
MLQIPIARLGLGMHPCHPHVPPPCGPFAVHQGGADIRQLRVRSTVPSFGPHAHLDADWSR